MPNEKHINKKHLAHLEVVRRQDRIIRISALIIILVVVGIVGYGILTNTVLLPYRLVASVNGDKITAGEFQIQAKVQRVQAINRYMQYMQYAQMFGVQDPTTDANFGPLLQKDSARLSDTNVLGQEVVDLLVNDRLIRQEAKKRGLVVTTEEVNKAMEDSFGYYPAGTPTVAPTATALVPPTLNPTELAIVTITPTPGPVVPTATSTPDPAATPTLAPTLEPTATAGPTATDAPTATAAPTATPITQEGYTSLLKTRVDGLQTTTGLDEAGYRRLIETSLLRDKLLADLTKDMKTTQDQVWARHILVKTAEEAIVVETRLKSGEDFAKVASEVSIDTGSKDKGGDLGWFGKGAMVAPFEEAAYSLPIGQISQPIQSTYGFHIIQVIGHEERAMTDQQIQTEKQTILTDFLTKLRASSDVQIFDVWKTIVPTEPTLPAQ